jgi:hypothetical protein
MTELSYIDGGKIAQGTDQPSPSPTPCTPLGDIAATPRYTSRYCCPFWLMQQLSDELGAAHLTHELKLQGTFPLEGIVEGNDDPEADIEVRLPMEIAPFGVP